MVHTITHTIFWTLPFNPIATLRESHAVILRDRVVPASQVPFPGEPSGEPGNGTWRAGTTLYRRNDSVGFFFSPVAIKLLQRIRTKTSFYQFCIRFIRIYRLLWSSARVRNELLTNHRRDIKTQGEGRWTRQRDGFISCLMWSDIFSLSHYKIKEIARVRRAWTRLMRAEYEIHMVRDAFCMVFHARWIFLTKSLSLATRVGFWDKWWEIHLTWKTTQSAFFSRILQGMLVMLNTRTAQSWRSWKLCEMDLSNNCSRHGGKSEVCEKIKHCTWIYVYG